MAIECEQRQEDRQRNGASRTPPQDDDVPPVELRVFIPCLPANKVVVHGTRISLRAARFR
jgi:hypothetical protein